jgi:hypothetical protein
MLYHCLRRDQLQNCACGVFLIWHAVPKDPRGLLELFGIGVLNPRVSHFRQVEHAAEAFFGYYEVISRNGYGQIKAQKETDQIAHQFSLAFDQCFEILHVAGFLRAVELGNVCADCCHSLLRFANFLADLLMLDVVNATPIVRGSPLLTMLLYLRSYIFLLRFVAP